MQSRPGAGIKRLTCVIVWRLLRRLSLVRHLTSNYRLYHVNGLPVVEIGLGRIAGEHGEVGELARCKRSFHLLGMRRIRSAPGVVPDGLHGGDGMVRA